MGNFNGQLRSNEIFAALYNMIISQQVFADNIKGTKSQLVDLARVDGSLYGDTKLYYATDILKSADWGNDAEAANLLQLYRPKAPACQKIIIDKFRQICLTVDNYLTKQAWGTEGAFSEFNSVMKGWIRETKRVYDSTLYNTYIGTSKTTTGKQEITITLPTQALGIDSGDAEAGENLEATARLQAQTIAKTMAQLLMNLEDVSRDYNDYGYLRSYNSDDLIAVWNSDAVIDITKMDVPTIFNKENLVEKLGEHVLPARYFGDVNAATVTTADGSTIRSLIEQEVTLVDGFTAPDGTVYSTGDSYHLFAGDIIPQNVVLASAGTVTVPSYTENPKILFKLIHKRSVPYMSGFEVGTSFFNPKSLTETNYLTFGHNTLEYLKNYPFITVKKA